MLEVIIIRPLGVARLPFFVNKDSRMDGLGVRLFVSAMTSGVGFNIIRLTSLGFVTATPRFRVCSILVRLITIGFFTFLSGIPRTGVSYVMLFYTKRRHFSFSVVTTYV